MEDYNSKYTGEQVEEFLDQIANGDIGGETLTEAEIADMGFTKNEGTITEVKMNGVSKGASGIVDLGTVITAHQDISGKVDKVTGKGLSTEDFTSALKSKLEGLSNYDDTELSEALSTLRGDFDKLVSGDTTTAIKTFNEIVAFLEGIEDSQDLEGIIASIEQQIAGKQDAIKDLATIREGASKGATAVQPSDIPEETYLADFTMFSLRQGMNNGGQVNCDINSLIEAMTANKTILVREDKESDGYKGVCVLNGYAEDLLYFSIVDHAGDILYCEGTNYTNTSSYIDGRTLRVRRWDDKQDALVSGENIKTINGESIVGEGDITITGGSGTITEIKANGTSVATSGVANIPAASTSAYGVTKLTSSTSSTSTTLAATASAVKSAYDLANSYKGTVTGVKINGTTKSPSSGTVDVGNVVTSIKVNGNTYSPSSGVINLGTINGGGGSSGVEGKEFIEMEPDYEPSGNTGSFFRSSPLEPNKVYVFSQPINILQVNAITESGSIGDEYAIMFTASESTTITIANYQVYWANGTIPTIESGDMCELSLVRIGNVMKATLGIFKAV